MTSIKSNQLGVSVISRDIEPGQLLRRNADLTCIKKLKLERAYRVIVGFCEWGIHGQRTAGMETAYETFGNAAETKALKVIITT